MNKALIPILREIANKRINHPSFWKDYLICLEEGIYKTDEEAIDALLVTYKDSIIKRMNYENPECK